MKKSDKNVSKTIQKGDRIQTRDNHLESGAGYVQPGYENGKGGNYRPGVVIDTNRNDELAIIKLTSEKNIFGNRKKGVIQLVSYDNGKSWYKPYVETKDDKGMPIKIGEKFELRPANKRLPHNEVVKMTKTIHKNKDNKKKIRELKGRKKDE